MRNDKLAIFADAVKAGAAWVRTLNAPDLRKALPFIATSSSADAFLISAWAVYHGHGDIKAMRPSRGYKWIVCFHNLGERIVRVSNSYDHRAGVEILAS